MGTGNSGDEKSGQEVAKGISSGQFSKGDYRYWEDRVFKPVYTERGKQHETRHYAARIQFEGRRLAFPLGM